MCAWLQPARIVQCAGFDRDSTRPILGFVVYPGPALWAKDTEQLAIAVRLTGKRLRLTLHEPQRRLVNDHRHAECAARLPLAFSAMAHDDLPGFANNLVANGAALTTSRMRSHNLAPALQFRFSRGATAGSHRLPTMVAKRPPQHGTGSKPNTGHLRKATQEFPVPFETGDCVALLRDTEIAALLRSERSERLEGRGSRIAIWSNVNCIGPKPAR